MWEGVGDRTELQYIGPHSYGRQRCVFLVLQGCSTGGPGAQLFVNYFSFLTSSIYLMWVFNTSFNWNLSDCNFPLVFRTLLSILANRNNAVKWIVFILPLSPNSTSIFSKTFVTFQVHKLQQVSSSPSSSVDFYFRLVGWLVRFYDTSTFVGYLMPNSFYTNNQFYFKLFNLAWVHSLTIQFQGIQFSQTVLIQKIQFSLSIDFVYTQLNIKAVLC